MSEALGLPRTAGRIVDALARTRQQLSVAEISDRVRASERSVRQNLGLLLNRGLLDRQPFVTSRQKSAYAYSLRSIDELLTATRQDLRRTVERLEVFARRWRRVRA